MAKTQTMYPAAYFTVLRAGLLGAAQAVWVLEPAQRRERGRSVTVGAQIGKELTAGEGFFGLDLVAKA